MRKGAATSRHLHAGRELSHILYSSDARGRFDLALREAHVGRNQKLTYRVRSHIWTELLG